jgi:DNA-binding beta-propeller fold protein YncE
MLRRAIASSGGVFISLAAAVLVAGVVSADPATPAPSGYHVLKTIPLGGVEGWDYLSMDSAIRRLYIGRIKYMDVLDVDSGTVVAKLKGMPGVHGIALASDLGRGFTVEGKFAGGDNTSTILDLKTLQKIGTVKTGKDPDSYAYDEATKRVFIMNSGENDATAINAADGTVAGTVPFDGQPEFAVSDGNGDIFVNITDKNQILEFDGRTMKVLHHWSLGPCEGPSGLSMDRKNRRLFSVCDNQKMVVMNADTGEVIAAIPVGAGADASLFDPATQNAFASAGGCGNLTVIHEDSPDKFRVLEVVPTQSGARTMALDTRRHNVLLITARHGHGSTFGEILPDTFVVLVVGR